MSPQLSRLKVLAIILLLGFVFASFVIQAVVASSQQEKPRAIISDDFTKARPKGRKRVKATANSRKPRKYLLASSSLTGPLGQSNRDALQLGLTIWKLQPLAQATKQKSVVQLEWIPKRVEADTQFRDGDLVRLSIESPRAGYLYVINRDWYADGSTGETSLIFPNGDEDNRLEAGRLISIPAEHQSPFRASPKSNQAGAYDHSYLISARVAPF